MHQNRHRWQWSGYSYLIDFAHKVVQLALKQIVLDFADLSLYEQTDHVVVASAF